MSIKTAPSLSDPIPVLKVQLPLPPPIQKTPTDVLSLIEFFNSPYLDIESEMIPYK